MKVAKIDVQVLDKHWTPSIDIRAIPTKAAVSLVLGDEKIGLRNSPPPNCDIDSRDDLFNMTIQPCHISPDGPWIFTPEL
jgi:hypothetical protein